MKSIVLKLLREQNGANVADNFNDTIYSSCQTCLDSVLSLFKQASEGEKPETDTKQIAVEADNLTWLLDVLAERQAAEEFSVTWFVFAGRRHNTFCMDVILQSHINNISLR
ncbi:putative BTB/POZ domain-containing protein [Arabidopsis thaliana]